MRLFKILPAFILPFAAFALPNADAAPEAAPAAKPDMLPRAPIAIAQQVYELVARDLRARQLDLGNLTGLLSGLGGDLSSILDLLSPSFINDIQSVVTNAAALLTPTFVNNTVSLIDDVAPVSSSKEDLNDKPMTRNQLVTSVSSVLSALISSLLR